MFLFTLLHKWSALLKDTEPWTHDTLCGRPTHKDFQGY